MALSLEWTASGTTFSFKRQTKVSIVKQCFATTTAGSYAVTVPDATQNQTLTVSLWKPGGRVYPALLCCSEARAIMDPRI